MSDELWSDAIIHDEVVLRVREQKHWAGAIRVATNVRDDYQRELAALRAQVAEQEEKFDHYTTETTGIVVALNAENEQLKKQLAFLTNELRLFRRTPKGNE